MPNWLIDLRLPSVGWRDLLDLAIISLVIYEILKAIRVAFEPLESEGAVEDFHGSRGIIPDAGSPAADRAIPRPLSPPRASDR